MSDRVTRGLILVPKCSKSEENLDSTTRKRRAFSLGILQSDPSLPCKQHIRDLNSSRKPGPISAATGKGGVGMKGRREGKGGR